MQNFFTIKWGLKGTLQGTWGSESEGQYFVLYVGWQRKLSFKDLVTKDVEAQKPI